MIGFALGLLYSNAGEWFLHKYVLHGLGRSKKSFWSFHWHEHHKNSRKHEMVDPCYERSVFGNHAQGREALGIAMLVVGHAPLLPISPGFVAGVWFSAARYYYVHKRAHQDPAWAKENLRWHYDHHMGANQDANWCVSFPLFDYVMGTRIEMEDAPSAKKETAASPFAPADNPGTY